MSAAYSQMVKEKYIVCVCVCVCDCCLHIEQGRSREGENAVVALAVLTVGGFG